VFGHWQIAADQLFAQLLPLGVLHSKIGIAVVQTN
jgi:hypothetical protein